VTGRSFFKSALAAGKYRILSNVVHDDENLLVIKRGKNIELVRVPVNILNVASDASVLELTEGSGFKNITARPELAASELDDIDNYNPAGPTPR
jgi:hypothetical protein